MSELLQSIKADLLSKHMLALLAVAAVALLGALAYVVTGGGAGAKAPTVASAAPPSKGLPVAVVPPDTATSAAAETPAGIQYQTQGSTRNPFAPLPGTPLAKASAASAPSGASSAAGGAKGPGGSASSSGSKSSGSSAKSGGSSGSGSSSSGAAKVTPAPSPSPPSRRSSPSPTVKVQTLSFYSVSALFGLAPANPGEQAKLTPYEELKLSEALPTARSSRVVFVGVNERDKVKRAVFALVVPPILRGKGSCFPDDIHCEAIELAAGQSEELEYVKPGGETIAFELKVVKISRRNAPVGATQEKALQISRQGRRVLNRAGLSGLL